MVPWPQGNTGSLRTAVLRYYWFVDRQVSGPSCALEKLMGPVIT